jgi:hypothetical protein
MEIETPMGAVYHTSNIRFVVNIEKRPEISTHWFRCDNHMTG